MQTKGRAVLRKSKLNPETTPITKIITPTKPTNKLISRGSSLGFLLAETCPFNLIS